MTRWMLRGALFTLVVFAASMMVIRAQPYDDPELRTLFAAEGCAAPCFMNIQPGVTEVDEAIKILEHNAWVKHVEPHTVVTGTDNGHVRGFLFWDWNSHAPAWLQATSGAALDHAGAITTLDGVVDTVLLATRIPFGRLRVLYGAPDGYSLSVRNTTISRGVFQSATLHYQHAYLQNQIEIEATTPCRELTTLWFNPSAVMLFSEARKSRVIGNFFLDRPFLEQTVYIRKLLCHA